jgi:hypothetical protein
MYRLKFRIGLVILTSVRANALPIPEEAPTMIAFFMENPKKLFYTQITSRIGFLALRKPRD